MEKTSVIWFELSDSQKATFLENARAYMKQQVERRTTEDPFPPQVWKNNLEPEHNLDIMGQNKMSTLKNTIERIRNLEEEKKSLLLEIEELKRMSEAKANALESEVAALRDEVKSLRILMTGGVDPRAADRSRFKK